MKLKQYKQIALSDRSGKAFFISAKTKTLTTAEQDRQISEFAFIAKDKTTTYRICSSISSEKENKFITSHALMVGGQIGTDGFIIFKTAKGEKKIEPDFAAMLFYYSQPSKYAADLLVFSKKYKILSRQRINQQSDTAATIQLLDFLSECLPYEEHKDISFPTELSITDFYEVDPVTITIGDDSSRKEV